jgi:hypothetical protein
LGNEVCPALFCDISDLSILEFERSFAEHRRRAVGLPLRNIALPVPPTANAANAANAMSTECSAARTARDATCLGHVISHSAQSQQEICPFFSHRCRVTAPKKHASAMSFSWLPTDRTPPNSGPSR